MQRGAVLDEELGAEEGAVVRGGFEGEEALCVGEVGIGAVG